MGLFCLVLELRPFEDKKYPFSPKSQFYAVFCLQMTVTRELKWLFKPKKNPKTLENPKNHPLVIENHWRQLVYAFAD